MVILSKVNWKGPQPAPKYLANRLRVSFPQIIRTEIYNDRNIAGTQKKSAHAEGRALDIYVDVRTQLTLGDQLFRALVRNAKQDGIDNVIWNREIWSQAFGGPRRYSGVHPHTDHIHVEFTRVGSQQRVLRGIDREIAIIRSGMEDLRQFHGRFA